MVQRVGATPWRRLELNGGWVSERSGFYRFHLPPVGGGYADAQIDDTGNRRRRFIWRPGTTLSLRARFSHSAEMLRGTAGFGFWNAPYGDPTRRRPVLPQATWYFFASSPNDLPFAPGSPGRGWFAATLDATTPRALAMIPLSPFVLALNHIPAARRRVWPAVRRGLGIEALPLDGDIRVWHNYELAWRASGCRFSVDGRVLLETTNAPRGPLAFVCWIDNQYMALTPQGRFRSGSLSLDTAQWLEVDNLRLIAD